MDQVIAVAVVLSASSEVPKTLPKSLKLLNQKKGISKNIQRAAML
jgi:hypothetical protein